MKWQCGRGRAGSARGPGAAAVGAAVCVLAALPGQARADGEPSPYAFDPGAKRISGAATTSEAKPLDAEGTYRDSIEPGGTLIYRLNLDAETNAYVSAVAVPGPATTVAYGDKIKISLQNSQGSDCGSNDAQFGAASKFPRPLAAYAYRLIEEGAYSCQEAGPYYVVIERTGEDTSTPEPWGLEIRHVSEPKLTGPGPSEAPSGWPSASPVPAGDEPQARAGGTGFYNAAELGKGEWTTEIEPGASLFYRVPVDWGQQIFAAADLGSAAASGPGSGSRSGFVSGAFSMALYNPARGLVDTSNSLSYTGKQKTTSLDPLPPVAYENRFGSRTGDKEMRFAGWYYLRVSLNPEVGEKFGAGPYGLTLRVDVEGDPKDAPAYAGSAGDFSVNPDDRQSATDDGTTGTGAADNDAMKLVAAGGIGVGTVLVLGLGVWTLLARRRAEVGSG
ncbi:hypothetical protein ACFRMN_33830 [Streptomyces sp. NPDC056835]|uniref:hypothetical protein n=1 Tax=Streptomyces sp. NPDC056835 TaxID=3345956 RepID=UPI003680D55B